MVISAKTGASNDRNIVVVVVGLVFFVDRGGHQLSDTVRGVQEREAEELGGVGHPLCGVQNFARYVVVGVELSNGVFVCVMMCEGTMGIAPWLCFVLSR